MNAEFEKSIEGKNPKRVLPGVRKQVKIQRIRFTGYVVVSLLLCFSVAGGFIDQDFPLPLHYFSMVALPFMLFGAFADFRIYNHQKLKVKYIEGVISSSSKQ